MIIKINRTPTFTYVAKMVFENFKVLAIRGDRIMFRRWSVIEMAQNCGFKFKV